MTYGVQNNKATPVTPPPQPKAQQNSADKFLEQAMRFKGQPYLWGGGHGGNMSGPGPVDCSGLITQAGQLAGVNLGGTAADQQRMGQHVSMNDLKPGDLVFMGTPAHHVGIYIGNGQVLHAPHTGDHVRIGSINDGWDSARRVFDEAGGAIDTKGLPEDAPATRGEYRGGDASAIGGGSGRPSGLNLPAGTSNWIGGQMMAAAGEEEERKRREAAGDTSAVKVNPGHHSGLKDINSTDFKGFEPLMAKLEAQGVTKEFLQGLSEKYGVPLEMILGVIQQESGGDANAKSGVGAQGLMQLMPETARGLGVTNPLDPKQNVEGGVKYLAEQLRTFHGDTSKALAAYNAGPGNVQKFGGVPPFAETQHYVANITKFMDQGKA